MECFNHVNNADSCLKYKVAERITGQTTRGTNTNLMLVPKIKSVLENMHSVQKVHSLEPPEPTTSPNWK